MSSFPVDPFADAYFSHLLKGIDKVGKVLVGLAEKKKLKIKGVLLLEIDFCGGGWLNHEWVRG
ncbi:MAG: hypothetical protein JRJ77_14860 [Deltaproteobacteria bacterium]|nr:hypothetical protein [Deltaproteobacteria bacterium]